MTIMCHEITFYKKSPAVINLNTGLCFQWVSTAIQYFKSDCDEWNTDAVEVNYTCETERKVEGVQYESGR